MTKSRREIVAWFAIAGLFCLTVGSLCKKWSCLNASEHKEVYITNHLVAAQEQIRMAESCSVVTGRDDGEDVRMHVMSAERLLRAIENEPGVRNRLRVLKKRLDRWKRN